MAVHSILAVHLAALFARAGEMVRTGQWLGIVIIICGALLVLLIGGIVGDAENQMRGARRLAIVLAGAVGGVAGLFLFAFAIVEPVYQWTGVSVFGLYTGLGSVAVGGLIFSSIVARIVKPRQPPRDSVKPPAA